jgi:hypothetical protein
VTKPNAAADPAASPRTAAELFDYSRVCAANTHSVVILAGGRSQPLQLTTPLLP